MRDEATGFRAWRAGAGYLVTWVPGRGVMYVHRLVWELAYGPIPRGLEINHLNGVKTDNRLENLELVTRSQNQKHAVATGLLLPPPTRSHRKLTDANIAEIRRDYRPRKVTARMLAARFGVHPETVARIVRGASWT